MAKIVYLPGLFGSTLSARRGDTYMPVWVDPAGLAAGDARYLQLDATATGPGPLADGLGCVATGIFNPVYGPLGNYLSRCGHDVYYAYYDWRLSVIATAAVLWPSLAAWAEGHQIHFVAHSFGGLVARALYREMVDQGAAAQYGRLVTLCTPHYGSMEIVRLWSRLPQLYQGLLLLTNYVAAAMGYALPDYLDAITASWPGCYELMPFAGAGPLFESDPAQAAAIYTRPFYGDGNQSLSPSSFLEAQTVQTLLAAGPPGAQVTSLYGTGFETAYELRTPYRPEVDAGYLWTQAGDGIVTAAQAAYPGADLIQINESHALAPLNPFVWGIIASLLPA